jgi:hypothetical protein
LDILLKGSRILTVEENTEIFDAVHHFITVEENTEIFDAVHHFITVKENTEIFDAVHHFITGSRRFTRFNRFSFSLYLVI